jgi:integrase
MAQKLDDRTVKSLEAPASGNRITYDSEVKGFGVRVTAKGAKAFILNYRNKHGVDRRYTIGAFGDWQTVPARNEAKLLKRLIDQGRDPVAEREHERTAPTVAELCDRYLAEHVDLHNKPRTRAENRRIVEKIIKPKLGRLKVKAVDHDDVAKLHRELRATPRQANHVVAVLSKMFNLAEVWKDGSGERLRPLNSNPCRHIKRYPEVERDSYATPDQLARIGRVMQELEDAGTLRPELADSLRFLALSGVRLSEAAGLDLDDVNFRTGAWSLPDAKAGKRVVMLGAPALALLASLGRTSGPAFPRWTGKRKGQPISVSLIEKAWSGEPPQPKHRKRGKKGIRELAGCPDLRVHDLRHTTGTYAGASGLNAFVVRDLLGHKTLAMTGKYVNRFVDPLRAAADAVSQQIAAAMKGESAEVVEMPGRAAR